MYEAESTPSLEATAPAAAADSFRQVGGAGVQAHELSDLAEWPAAAVEEAPVENASWGCEPAFDTNHCASAEELAPNVIGEGEIKSDALCHFCVGDLVYRQGELASVVHVDTTLDPASYVVRNVQTNQEVSCEAENLESAIYSDEPAP